MSRAICPKCGCTDVSWIRDDADCAQYICLECKQCFSYPPKTLFNHITASPAVLAPKLVYVIKQLFTISGTSRENPGGYEVKTKWFSTIVDGDFDSQTEAIAATVAKLKEVEK